MKQADGKIGIREYYAIIFYTIGSKMSDNTPTILYQTAKNAGWISMLLISLLSIVPILFLLKVLSAYKGKNLFEILIALFGQTVGRMIAFGLFLFGFSALVLDSAMYVEIIGTMYFSMTPFIVIYAILFIICGYGAVKGLEQIGSVAWGTFYYLQASFLLVLFLILNEGIPGLIHPLLGAGAEEIIKTAGKNISIYADLLFISMIAPMVSTYKAFRKGTLLFFGVFSVQFTFVLILFVMIFDFTSIEALRYPYHEVLRYISLGFLRNTETLFFPFWLIAVFVRFAIYLYLAAFLFGEIFNIKEFKYLIPVMSVLLTLIGLLLKTPVLNIPDMREWLLTALSPVFFLLPVIMWFIMIAKRRFEK